MSKGIWTVEGPFFNDRGALCERWETWAVVDGDGNELCHFATREHAERWLELQQAAAEQQAEGER